MSSTQTGNFHGLPTRVLHNDHIRLEFLAEAGPRIVHLSLADSAENLFAEIPDFKVATPYGDYHFRGGHRLWHAPEALPRSYIPDDSNLIVTSMARGARLDGALEVPTGLRKSIEIELQPDRPAVILKHQLLNSGAWPIEVAPWAITQLKPGGIGILPQPNTPTGLLANRHFAFWPYARWSDPRLEMRDDFVLFRAVPGHSPFKIGYFNTHGWLGYWRNGVFFRKRFDQPTASPYPDFNSNAEVYCNDDFIELESLGPLRRLEPGEAVMHVETWEIYRDSDLPDLSEEIRTRLADLDREPRPI
jgi:hypothetical protein